MKTILPRNRNHAAGYALLMVMGIVAVSLIVLASTMQRTAGVALLNNRNNTYVVNVNAAESAVEKVYARLSYDFVLFGVGGVVANLPLYRTNVPNAAESAYWNNFRFSDGQGNTNRTYVSLLTNYSGPLPSQYPGLSTKGAPVYRIVSNARNLSGTVSMTNAAQVDVLLALVPLSSYAIFYNSLLEFSTAATMTVNGRVHANGNIYTGSSSPLTFNDTVTTSGTLTSPKNNGQGPTWDHKGDFKGTPKFTTNLPAVTLTINMTNTHSMIDLPPAGESATSIQGLQRLYNQAQVVLLVSNTTVTARIQTSVSGEVPGADAAPQLITSSTNILALATNFPFLTLTNRFTDQRENKVILTTQIDVGKYATWIKTSAVTNKFPLGSGSYPTILFAADNRTHSGSQLTAVRLVNGTAPPPNGGLGWSLATPNPLYVLGNYNATNHLASTNTTTALPSALMSDALTLLSSTWNDALSFTSDDSGQNSANSITVNAAILTGIVPSTGNTSSTFSGGVHNLPRLLEDWGSGSRHVWLNTSIINLFNSTKATGQFVTPGSGSYYTAPERHFSFDLNFLDPAKQPPGMPCALVPIRYNWAVPPANTVSYHVAQ